MNLAFVPVRGGSKSIPKKNIKDFCGKPLVFWSLKALNDSENIDKIIVATDCKDIKDTVNSLCFEKVEIYNRSSESATDTASTESVVLEYLRADNRATEDVFVLVQATSPQLTTQDINNALLKFKKENADSLLSCVRIKKFFWNEEGVPINYSYSSRPRRQDFPGTLMENGAIYITTVGQFLKSKNRLSGKISIYEMAENSAIEIDEEEDWELAEKSMRGIKNNLNKIRIFLTDVDGTLTDAGMYYDDKGNELKKFNTHDGKGFDLLREKGIKIGILTTEVTTIVENRAKKLKVDYLYQGVQHGGKLKAALEICRKEGVELEQVAYIGDDLNCIELLKKVGYAACPKNSVESVKKTPNIHMLKKKGGEGAVREFIDFLFINKCI